MATPQAIVQALEGAVSVTRNGQEVNIKAGDYLLPGDVVQTGENGRLSLEFPGVEGQTPAAGVMSPGGKITLGEQPGPAGQQIVVLEDTECFEFTSEITENSAAAEGTSGLFGGDFAGGGVAVAGAGAAAAGIFAGGGSSSDSGSGSGTTLSTSSGTTTQTPAEVTSNFVQDTVKDPTTLPENTQAAVESVTSGNGWILTENGWVRAVTGDDTMTDGGSTTGGGSATGANGAGGASPDGGTSAGGGTTTDSGAGGSGTTTSNPLSDTIRTVADASPIADSTGAVTDGINQSPAGEPAAPVTEPVASGGQSAEAGSDSLLEQLAGAVDDAASGSSPDSLSAVTGTGIVTEVANAVADATSPVEQLDPVNAALQDVAQSVDAVIDQVITGADGLVAQLQDAAPPELTNGLSTLESGLMDASSASPDAGLIPDSLTSGDLAGVTDVIAAGDGLSADSLNADTLAGEAQGLLGSVESLAQQLQSAGSQDSGGTEVLGDLTSGISSAAADAGVDIPDGLTGGGLI